MKNVHLITKEQEGADVLHQYLYITSDEDIKEGDWVIAIEGIWKNTITKITGTPITDVWMKIILTTDPDLIGVQSIDNEFLEWFVKNPSCERAEVVKGKMQLNDDGQEYGFPDMSLYKIIIPQGEPKQESHICKYCDAETTQPDDECYAKPAQYPLEDFIRRESKSGNESVGILKGVIWQSERIPSIIEEYLETAFISKEQGYMNPQKWFEQFKKK
jgi:hypothetical protein